MSHARVTFEPGARSARHTHPLGRTLTVATGCGWTQPAGQAIVETRAGDVAWCPSGHKLWQAATPAAAMAHIAVQEALDGKKADGPQEMADAAYLAGPAR